MKTYILTIIVLFSLISNSFSQDTIRVLQYNLLDYDVYDHDCTDQNNNISTKTDYLKTIINYINPDIFAVNEINNTSETQNYLLNNVFLLNGKKRFKMASVNTYYLSDQIYYNSNKFTLKKEQEINAYPRPIKAYLFYYNSPDLNNGDTVYFYYFVAHLKAGQSQDQTDENDRAKATNNLMNFIRYKVGSNTNYIFSGDFNLYTNTEQAYQNLINYSYSNIQFIDPGIEGCWHDSIKYANIQTQSTQYSGNGCSVGGGLDDRFDFILFSKDINSGNKNMKYIPNSFKVIGQDGKHFNDAVNYKTNNSVPSKVLTALANNSDHLPVFAEFYINQTPAGLGKNINRTIKNIKINNFYKNKLIITIQNNSLLKNNIYIKIFDIAGKEVLKKDIKIYPYQIKYTVNTSNIHAGFYEILFYSASEEIQNIKTFLK